MSDGPYSAAPQPASDEEWVRRWDPQWPLAWDWYRIEQHRAGLAGLTPERLRELVGDGASLNPTIPSTSATSSTAFRSL